MTIYTLKRDAFILGDEQHPDYGWSYQAYVEEADFPIKFSSKKEGFLQGRKIIAKSKEVKKFKTGKNAGKEYIWLTGVSLNDEDSGGAGDSDNTTSPQPELNVDRQVSPSPSIPAAATDNKYLKDATTLPLDVYRVRAQINGLPDSSDQRKPFFRNVRLDALYLMQMIEEVRDGSFAEKTAETAQSLKAVTANEVEDISDDIGKDELDGLFPD